MLKCNGSHFSKVNTYAGKFEVGQMPLKTIFDNNNEKKSSFTGGPRLVRFQLARISLYHGFLKIPSPRLMR